MAQQQLYERDLERCIVPVCKEFKLPFPELDVLVKKKNGGIVVILQRGSKSLKVSYNTWINIIKGAKEVEVIKDILEGTTGLETSTWQS